MAARGQFSGKKILILISCKWPPLPLAGYGNTAAPVAEARRGVARRHDAKGCVTKVGARVAHGAGDSKLRSEGGPSGGGGGSKKSDKTMERNLNYAPRKMAIVCKAMLIRQRRKGGGRRLRRRRQTQKPSVSSSSRRNYFSSSPGPPLPLLFFFRYRQSLLGRISLPAIALLFTHLAHRCAFSTCRSTFRMVFSFVRLILPSSFSRFIFALYNCASSSCDRRNLR